MIERWQTSRLSAMMKVRRGVNLTGARQSGKTTLAEMVDLPRARRYTFDDKLVRGVAQSDPNGFVQHANGESIVIDEVQKVPDVLDSIKMVVDKDQSPGQYLLTGSANLRFAKAVKDSLAGRLGRVRLRTTRLFAAVTRKSIPTRQMSGASGSKSIWTIFLRKMSRT